MHFLGLRGGSCLSGANSPDRFIGDYHLLDLRINQMEKAGFNLFAHQILMATLFTYLERFSATKDGSQSRAKGDIDFGSQQRTVFPKVLAPFAVTDDHVFRL